MAVAYRLTDHFGITTLVYNHITARVPGTDDQFLINEYGLGYDEIAASDLVKMGMDGNILQGGKHRIGHPDPGAVAAFCWSGPCVKAWTSGRPANTPSAGPRFEQGHPNTGAYRRPGGKA